MASKLEMARRLTRQHTLIAMLTAQRDDARRKLKIIRQARWKVAQRRRRCWYRGVWRWLTQK